MTLRIEIRDARLPTRRLSLKAGTADPAERDRRRQSLVSLLETERGRDILERLRLRQLRLEQVHRAVQALDLASLEAVARARELRPIGLGETLDGWLAFLRGADRAAGTLDVYGMVGRSMERAFGVQRDPATGAILRDRPIAEISRADAEAWITGPQSGSGKVWSARTQKIAQSVAAQVWDRAITTDAERAEKTGTDRTIPRNFWRRDAARRGVRGARIRQTRVEFLRRAEAGRLLRALRGTPQAAWIAIGIYAGLRGGEAANLRTGIDLDLKRGVIRVQPRGGEFAWRTKTDNSVRNVPIHPRLARWLRAHIRDGYAGTYVFHLARGDRPLTRSGWRWWTKAAFEAAGIRYGRKKDALVYHSLRHTFASYLTVADVHPLKIARLMGDSVDMVIRTYSHLLSQDLEEAIRRL
jgi:integrase